MWTGFQVEENEFGAVTTETGARGVRQLLATVEDQLLDVAALLSECSGEG